MTKAASKKHRDEFVKSVSRGLRRAAREARKTAKMHGTPIYLWENGRVVAKKP